MANLFYIDATAEEIQKALGQFDFSKSLSKTGNFIVIFYDNWGFKGYRIWKSNPEDIAKKERNMEVHKIGKDTNYNELPSHARDLMDYLYPSETKRLKIELTNIICDLSEIATEIEGNDPEIVGTFIAKLHNFIAEYNEAEGGKENV